MEGPLPPPIEIEEGAAQAGIGGGVLEHRGVDGEDPQPTSGGAGNVLRIIDLNKIHKRRPFLRNLYLTTNTNIHTRT